MFENTRRFQHYIDSFNVQTNHWIAEYVYKRLRFLNNRNYSQLGALVFLALWHGFHSGYYVCFAIEFAVMIFEREVKKNEQITKQIFSQFIHKLIASKSLLQMEPVFSNSEKFQNFARTLPGQILIFIVLKLYTVLGMGFCFAPLVLLSFSKYWALHRSLWFFGYILWLPWPIYKPLLIKLLGSKKPERKKQ